MRIAVATPNFPPRLCGVGDYSLHLATELAREHSVTIFTSAAGGSGPFAFRPLEELARAEADVVLVQYTPYLYGKRFGLAPDLPGKFRALRERTRLVLMAHELHYPVNATLAGLTIGPLQRLQFRRLAQLSHQVIFSYEAPLATYSGPRFSWLPVGSNIPPLPNESAEEGNLLLHFGGAHPTHLYDHVWEVAKKAGRPVHCLGISQEELDAWLGTRAEELVPLGRLPAEAVSRWLSRSALVLAPFLDGISTRRGSAMAAFAHGKAVLTTRDWATNASVPWEDFCFFAAESSAAAFAARAVELLASSARNEAGFRARAYYERELSWPAIARGLLGRISR